MPYCFSARATDFIPLCANCAAGWEIEVSEPDVEPDVSEEAFPQKSCFATVRGGNLCKGEYGPTDENEIVPTKIQLLLAVNKGPQSIPQLAAVINTSRFTINKAGRALVNSGVLIRRQKVGRASHFVYALPEHQLQLDIEIGLSARVEIYNFIKSRSPIRSTEIFAELSKYKQATITHWLCVGIKDGELTRKTVGIHHWYVVWEEAEKLLNITDNRSDLILQLLRSEPGLWGREIAARLHLSPHTVQRLLHEFEESGRVRLFNQGKRKCYELI